MGIAVVLAEAVVAINVMVIPYGVLLWLVLGVITLAVDFRSRARSVEAASSPVGSLVSAFGWPAKSLALRVVGVLALTVIVFRAAYALSGTPAWSFLVVASFAVGVALLCALDVMSVILLLRFGSLVRDVFMRGTVAGRDTLHAYAAVTLAFAVPGLLSLAGLSPLW
jgi:hypothetical protein